MTEEKRERLRILTANKYDTVAELYQEIKERRSYLIIDNNLDENTLKSDVEKGAQVFEPLTKVSAIDLESRVTLIRGRYMENLLKAVSYLAPIHNKIDGIIPYHEQDYGDKDDEAEECEGDYKELLNAADPVDSEFYIPIVSDKDLAFAAFDPSDFGIFGKSTTDLQAASRWERTKRFYNYQKKGPVIITFEHGHHPFYGHNPFYGADFLDEFKENRRVYICCLEYFDSYSFLTRDVEDSISDSVSPFEFDIILDNDAAVLTLADSKRIPYLVKILDDTVAMHNVTLEKDFNKQKFIEKLDKVKADFQAKTISDLVRREGRRSTTGTIGASLFKLIGKYELKEDSLTGWAKLDSLVGMADVKKSIRSIVDASTYAYNKKLYFGKGNMPNILMFVGAPGVAKTTVAEALADIFFENNILQGKRFISLSGAQLQAPYLGQTAQKVHDTFATHDVIFIDEAYSLAETDSSLYAREALAQLCVELEDAARAQNKIIILAGYGGNESDEKSNKMREFLNSNPGIKSRISWVVNFTPYSPEECTEIVFGIMKSEGYSVSQAMSDAVREPLIAFFEKKVKEEGFGNGRDCRNLVMHAERKAADRTVHGRKLNEVEISDINVLLPEDIIGAMKEMEMAENSCQGKTKRVLGFTC